jgi:predicted PurR-regulated permease PerM
VEVDLQRFWNLNRRFLMWIVFFAILILLRDFFAVMFLTFIFGFVMRGSAKWLHKITRVPYWLTVTVPYCLAVGLLVLLMMTTVPRVLEEGMKFSRDVPKLLNSVAVGIKDGAQRYGMEPVLAKYVNQEPAPEEIPESASPDENETPQSSDQAAQTTQPASAKVNVADLTDKIQNMLIRIIPGAVDEEYQGNLPEMMRNFFLTLVGATLQFLLAILLSFLIVLDYEAIGNELASWRQTKVGQFFQDAAASVVDFSGNVGKAFQCQMLVAVLNASITCIGMSILGIEPLVLLTTIVLIFGLIPVLGVFISSVPIILIAFNEQGLMLALCALAMIVIVHLLEAYVFNPRIYAARFHLNPVIVLIILLIAHELFGIWGMLLGIPVTHYVLNVAQVPRKPRKKSLLKSGEEGEETEEEEETESVEAASVHE